MRQECFGFKARPLHEKEKLYYLPLNLEIDATKNSRFLIALLIRTGQAIKFQRG